MDKHNAPGDPSFPTTGEVSSPFGFHPYVDSTTCQMCGDREIGPWYVMHVGGPHTVCESCGEGL